MSESKAHGTNDSQRPKSETAPDLAPEVTEQNRQNEAIANAIGQQYGDAFKKTFDPSRVNPEQFRKMLSGDNDVDPDVPVYSQEISDDLELWCNGLKVKDVRKETIECMPS